MGLLQKVIKAGIKMKILTIDNPDLVFQSFNDATQIITKGKKAIILPANTEVIITGGHLPHIKNRYLSGHISNIEKCCHKCKKWKLLLGFIKNKHAKDGYKDICASCDNERRRKRYAKTKSVT